MYLMLTSDSWTLLESIITACLMMNDIEIGRQMPLRAARTYVFERDIAITTGCTRFHCRRLYFRYAIQEQCSALRSSKKEK